MIIVKPSAVLEWITPNPELVIERAGRTSYKSEGKITETSHASFIQMLILRGHLSVLEHAIASVRMVTDRGCSHELVRHRIASFTQSSTRYCNYADDRFGNQISVVEPPDLGDDRNEWILACERAETSYLSMIRNGRKPEIARSVLPTCLATEIVTTCNFREWLHIFGERLWNKKAHPQMRELMGLVFLEISPHAPHIFGETTT